MGKITFYPQIFAFAGGEAAGFGLDLLDQTLQPLLRLEPGNGYLIPVQAAQFNKVGESRQPRLEVFIDRRVCADQPFGGGGIRCKEGAVLGLGEFINGGHEVDCFTSGQGDTRAAMKYFTMQDWQESQKLQDGDVEKLLAAERDYRAYISSIRAALPADAQRLHSGGGGLTLDDGNLEESHADFESSIVSLSLHGDFKDGSLWKASMSSWPVVAYVLSLNYSGVTSFSTFGDPKAGLPGPFGFGDIGANELERLEDGSFEHRILFSSGIEIRVRFADMQIELKPIP